MGQADRAGALLALLEIERERRSRELVEPARARARAALAEARRAARSRVHAALAAERAAFDRRVAGAEARAATARRMALQRSRKALLAEGWDRLPRAMRGRWDDPGGRRAWTEAALAAALATLPRDRWRIEGPAAWSEGDRDEALARLAREGIDAECAGAPDIEAGLRIASGRVMLDATLPGLLADRAQVEGRLLHALAEAAG